MPQLAASADNSNIPNSHTTREPFEQSSSHLTRYAARARLYTQGSCCRRSLLAIVAWGGHE
jgi:hypothetical protein